MRRRRRRWSRRVLSLWLALALCLSTLTYAIAEEVILTTYLPSPRGVFNELIVKVLKLVSPGNLQVQGSLAVGPTYVPSNPGDVLIEGRVGVGTSAPDPTAVLDVTSITQGFLPPRMTTFQRDEIVSPPPGLLVYNTTTDDLEVYKTGGWGGVSSSSVPAGAVMFFGTSTCPSGWSSFPAAVGRYVVGTTNGPSVGEVIGQALSDAENRPTGQHSHLVNDPGHAHLITGAFTGSTPGWRPYDQHCCGKPLTATTGITVGGVSGGAVPGTNAPYIQLLACQKN